MKVSEQVLLFHPKLNIFKNHLVANDARLRSTSDEINKLNSYVSDWNTVFLKYVDPALHSEPVVKQMQKAFDAVHSFVDVVRSRIQHDENIELTAADESQLLIKRRRPKRSHVQPYTTAPFIEALEHTHLMIVFSIKDPANLKRRRKPDDVKFIGIKIAFTEINAPAPAPSDYRTVNPTGRTLYRHQFKPEHVGKKVYLIAWYMNNRGESGPESEPASTIVI